MKSVSSTGLLALTLLWSVTTKAEATAPGTGLMVKIARELCLSGRDSFELAPTLVPSSWRLVEDKHVHSDHGVEGQPIAYDSFFRGWSGQVGTGRGRLRAYQTISSTGFKKWTVNFSIAPEAAVDREALQKALDIELRKGPDLSVGSEQRITVTSNGISRLLPPPNWDHVQQYTVALPSKIRVEMTASRFFGDPNLQNQFDIQCREL